MISGYLGLEHVYLLGISRVFVNGYPTYEISIQMSLNQGDPLDPFFLLVAEGLSDLIRKELGLGLLSSCRIRASNLVVSHLRCVDDTIILKNPSMDNL